MFRHAKKPRTVVRGLRLLSDIGRRRTQVRWNPKRSGRYDALTARSVIALSGQWPKAARRRWSTSGGEGYAGNTLRCAVKTASDSEPIFGGDFERSEKRSSDPSPPGPLPPGVPWGGVYFRITLSANAFRNAHVERYMHRSTSRTEDRSPFIGRYGFGDAHRTAGSAEHFRRSPRSLER